MRNIVLIGMPGSGKTYVGTLLAKLHEMDFFDTDTEIEKHAGMPVSRIFVDYGEEHFRRLETECIKNLCGYDKAVIATGGGAVERFENMQVAKMNATVVYLRRELDRIRETADFSSRPLLASNPRGLEEIYNRRKALYETYADISVDNNGTPEQTAICIMEAIK